MIDYLPLTRKHHTIVTSVEIGLKTQERMWHIAADNSEEDSHEYVLKALHDHLANNIRKELKERFRPGRKYKVEMGEVPSCSYKEMALTTIYSLAAYIYLLKPEDAEVGEVVHPSVFSSNIDTDELVETISGKEFEPVFDNQILSIMPVLSPEDALKYFVRVK